MLADRQSCRQSASVSRTWPLPPSTCASKRPMWRNIATSRGGLPARAVAGAAPLRLISRPRPMDSGPGRQEIARLTTLTRLAENEGRAFSTGSKRTWRDPHRRPGQGCRASCRRVPNLGITLDPSHYLVGTHPAKDYDAAVPVPVPRAPARHGRRPLAGIASVRARSNTAASSTI